MEERYFQHFKGGIYKYIGEAKDSETQDDLIIYQAMYGERKMWARPKGMFFEWITIDNKRTQRFRELTESEFQELTGGVTLKSENSDKDGFKPMDWCLMRRNTCRWELCRYSFFDGSLYHCVGGALFQKCIHYNDQTAHLLGTTDEWEGDAE